MELLDALAQAGGEIDYERIAPGIGGGAGAYRIRFPVTGPP